jgi:Lon protease-like protein
MLSFLRGEGDRRSPRLPLFPLNVVLFPGGKLPLKIFEQRYIEMAKACLRDDREFGVCLITRGDEVLRPGSVAAPPEFAAIGTFAKIRTWDMPQLGILHVMATGGARFEVQSHEVQADGLVVADATQIAPEPSVMVGAARRPLAEFLRIIAARVGASLFPEGERWEDASWVGYRLAEVLPLPMSIKQNMLEINDAEVRLDVLAKFLRQQQLI